VLLDHELLDADPWALGIENGWINLKDGTFNQPDPGKLMTMQAPVTFVPEATAPRWEQGLAEWLPDPEVRSYFQRLVGEAVVGTVRDHLLVLIYGGGGNGKGTAIGTLAKTLGRYFVVPDKSLLISSKKDGHPTAKASLFRARLAVAAETDRGSKLSEEQVKELTGGDRLGARRMYEDFWEFQPTHSLWLQTNHLPEVGGTDEGIWRRIRVLLWPNQFDGDKEDTALPETLATELPGILNWIIQGALDWQTHGLQEPESVRSESAAYRDAEDVVARFLEAAGYTAQPGARVKSKVLMDDWADWTSKELDKKRAGRELARRLRDLGYKKTNSRPPFWTGLGKAAEPTLKDLY
jgi:putative DNA primase/helicase